jgi:hypothetical protein
MLVKRNLILAVIIGAALVLSCSHEEQVNAPVEGEDAYLQQNPKLDPGINPVNGDPQHEPSDSIEIVVGRWLEDGSYAEANEKWLRIELENFAEDLGNAQNSAERFEVLQEYGIVAPGVQLSQFSQWLSHSNSRTPQFGEQRRHDINRTGGDFYSRVRVCRGEDCDVEGNINVHFFLCRFGNTYIEMWSESGGDIEIDCDNGSTCSCESDGYFHVILTSWWGRFSPPLPFYFIGEIRFFDRSFDGRVAGIVRAECGD